uniref:ditrans,polycis-polyprenyl diphosphate synthase [(2E,6E)-farnesyldiphosphate specific] n=1 Tax=Lepeophtheirus salmonis TaxID=72036 RepID=A0A0K2TZK8_LEPSM
MTLSVYQVLLILFVIYLFICFKRMPLNSFKSNPWIVLKDLKFEILSLILRCVHWLYNGALWVIWVTRRGGSGHETLSKIPHHLGIAFLEKDIDLKEVSKMISWIQELGIQILTLYDVNGHIKLNTKYLHHLLDQGNIAYNSSKSTLKSCLNLRIASHLDGKKAIADLANDLKSKTLHSYSSSVIKPEDISEKLIHSLLTTDSLPDPDVLIRCGGLESNMGFLPWHIRLTEIFDLYSHKGLRKADVISIFHKYSRCEKRFGA